MVLVAVCRCLWSSDRLRAEVTGDFREDKSVRADWSSIDRFAFVYFDVFLFILVSTSKLSSTNIDTCCWTSSVSWIGISPWVIDCGLRRAVTGGKGEVRDSTVDCARSADRLRRRRWLDLVRDWRSKMMDKILKTQENIDTWSFNRYNRSRWIWHSFEIIFKLL